MYCTKCGQKIETGLQFCTNCGTPVVPASQPVERTGLPSSPPSPPLAAPPAYAPVRKRSGLPVLLILLGVVALIVAVCVGGIVYVGYQVKQKVTSVAQTVKQALPNPAPPGPTVPGKVGDAQPPAPGDDSNLGGLLGSLGSALGGGDDDGDPVESISSKDPVEPCTVAPYPAQTAARIPLQPGTVITTAWGVKFGDVESRMTVASTDPTSVAFTYKTDKYKNDDGRIWEVSHDAHTTCNDDFAIADAYATVTYGYIPVIGHGFTRARLSDKSFQEVTSTGKTNLIYWSILSYGETAKPVRIGGLLTRVEAGDVLYAMIVNDQRVTLPAIHLTGVMDSVGKDPTPKKDRGVHSATEVYVIDDPLDPLVLMLRIKDPKYRDNRFRIEVTKIDYAVPHPVNLVEKQLAEQKRAVTWGIYFDFNKDTIKPESAPVLKQIVQAMNDNPDWKLTVEGNTDNIGGDTYNLDLSKRRAAAVKQALVTQYHIAPGRLSTDGFGASHPIDTNETLEGRARNRRVELSRE
jgi:outer membrane protein OmpA-like peptidoglycan-associated protein